MAITQLHKVSLAEAIKISMGIAIDVGLSQTIKHEPFTCVKHFGRQYKFSSIPLLSLSLSLFHFHFNSPPTPREPQANLTHEHSEFQPRTK